MNIPAGLLGSEQAASEVLFSILNRGEITSHLTISSTNINPNNDITIDNPAAYNGKKVKAVVEEILLLTNSVAMIDENAAFVVRARTSSNQVSHRFFMNPRRRSNSDNVYSIRAMNSGRHRVKNGIYWQGSTEFSQSEDHHVEQFGLNKKTISSDAITSTVTRQAIVNRLREEFQFPKEEFELETDYLGTAAQLLQTVTCDIQPAFSRQNEIPVAGVAVAGEAVAVGFSSGIFIIPEKGYKVIGIRHNLKDARTILKLREIGKTLTDGYFDMLTTQVYDVSFVAQEYVTINTAADSINARLTIVQVIDHNDEYDTEKGLRVTRPSTSEIKITSTTAITKDFKVYVVEVVPQ